MDVSGRLKLLLTVIALAAIAAVAIITLGPGSFSPEVATLKPREADLTSCAPHLASEAARRKDASGDGDLLVPANPEKALICRYYGYPRSVPTGGDTEGKIEDLATDAHLTSSRAAGSLAESFDALEAIAPGEYTCPEDNGAAAYVLFAYPAAPTVRVLVGLSGCEFVDSNATANGFSLSTALGRRLSTAR
jgi:hypothetical protein